MKIMPTNVPECVDPCTPARPNGLDWVRFAKHLRCVNLNAPLPPAAPLPIPLSQRAWASSAKLASFRHSATGPLTQAPAPRKWVRSVKSLSAAFPPAEPASDAAHDTLEFHPHNEFFRREVPTIGFHHGPPARSRRMPMGSRADLR